MYNDVCGGDMVPNKSNMHVMHQEKNMESIDVQELKEHERRSKNMLSSVGLKRRVWKHPHPSERSSVNYLACIMVCRMCMYMGHTELGNMVLLAPEKGLLYAQ